MDNQNKNVNKNTLIIKYKYIPRIAAVEFVSEQLRDRKVVRKQQKVKV